MRGMVHLCYYYATAHADRKIRPPRGISSTPSRMCKVDRIRCRLPVALILYLLCCSLNRCYPGICSRLGREPIVITSTGGSRSALDLVWNPFLLQVQAAVDLLSTQSGTHCHCKYRWLQELVVIFKRVLPFARDSSPHFQIIQLLGSLLPIANLFSLQLLGSLLPIMETFQ